MRTCSDCAAPVSKGSKNGRCRPCAVKALNADPVFRAAREAGLRAAMATPEWRAAHQAGVAKEGARRKADPVAREALSRSGREHGRANLVHARRPEAIARNVRARRISMQAWCPERFWELNRRLRERGHLLDDRKRIIGELVAVERRRCVSADTAASFLARWAPVYRCDERGRLDRTAGYWRYGSTVLTRDALIERACAKGLAA